jgi:hypothetical protein
MLLIYINQPLKIQFNSKTHETAHLTGMNSQKEIAHILIEDIEG